MLPDDKNLPHWQGICCTCTVYTSRVSSTAWRPFAVRDVASTTILPLPEQEITSPALTTELPLASFQFTLHTHTCP